MFSGFDSVILIGVVVPAGADGDVHLGGYPVGSVLVAGAQLQVAGGAGVVVIPVEGGPVGGVGEAALGAYPADIGPGVAEDDGVGLMLSDGSDVARPVVELLAFVCFAHRPVEPHFKNIAVAG